MQVKKVIAKDLRSALKVVREELGPNAIILSNKKVQNNIELLCTLDGSVLDKQAQEEPALEEATSLETIRALEEVNNRRPRTSNGASSLLERELDNMRREQIKKANDLALRVQAKTLRR